MSAPWAETPRCYLDDEVLKRERERCFVRRWTYACLARDVPEHDDWIALETLTHGERAIRVFRDGYLSAMRD